jgi:hypothetical protein
MGVVGVEVRFLLAEGVFQHKPRFSHEDSFICFWMFALCERFSGGRLAMRLLEGGNYLTLLAFFLRQLDRESLVTQVRPESIRLSEY